MVHYENRSFQRLQALKMDASSARKLNTNFDGVCMSIDDRMQIDNCTRHSAGSYRLCLSPFTGVYKL